MALVMHQGYVAMTELKKEPRMKGILQKYIREVLASDEVGYAEEPVDEEIHFRVKRLSELYSNEDIERVIHDT